MTASIVIESPIGSLTLLAAPNGLREIRFPNAPPLAGAAPQQAHDSTYSVLAIATAQLAEYFAGSRTTFDVPLAPRGTPFQLAAWHGLAQVPYATTVSYGQQAARLGHAGKARAVGAANGQNPLPIILPCHRVVGADGGLTGFGGGLATKAWLLDHEQRVAGLQLPL